jgi:hypothetical protein
MKSEEEGGKDMQQKTKKDIEKLLADFMKGQTNVDEERQLAEYFRNNQHVPKEWMDYKEMFRYFDNGMKEEAETAHLIPWKWLSIAASALFLLGMSSWLLSPKDKTTAQNAQSQENGKVAKTYQKETATHLIAISELQKKMSESQPQPPLIKRNPVSSPKKKNMVEGQKAISDTASFINQIDITAYCNELETEKQMEKNYALQAKNWQKAGYQVVYLEDGSPVLENTNVKNSIEM